MPMMLVLPGHDLIEHDHRLRLGAVAVDADHQANAHAVLAPRLLHGAEHAGHERLDGDAALGEALRANEQLGADHAVLVGPAR